MKLYIQVISIFLLQTILLVSTAHKGSYRSGLADRTDCERGGRRSGSRSLRHSRPRRHNVESTPSPPAPAGGDVGQDSPPAVSDDTDMQGDMPLRPPSNCSATCLREKREQIRLFRLETIKGEILRKLRLKNPPNHTGSSLPNSPDLQVIIEKYGMQKDQPSHISPHGYSDQGDDYHATTSLVINFGTRPPPEKTVSQYNQDQVVYFDIQRQNEVMRSSVEKATLFLFVRRPRGLDHNSNSLNATYFLIDKILPSPRGECRFKDKKVALTRRATARYYQFDVTRMVQNWISNPSANFGLRVISDTLHDGRPLVITNPTRSEEDKKPFLQLKLRDKGNSRSKRNLPNLDCDSDSTEERCCRYNLEVDFENFGWDWIIAPKRYQAYFCSGECSFVFMQRYPHSHVITQVLGNGGAGGPCCAPVKFSPISMLYFDDGGNIVYGTLPGMVVDRCGCS